MHWFIEPLRHYANFKGRARRRDYWAFFGICFAILVLVAGIDEALAPLIGWPDGVMIALCAVPFLCPGLAIAVRRLHDSNRSGWWTSLLLAPLLVSMIVSAVAGDTLWRVVSDLAVPLLVWLALAFLLCLPGTRGPNRFGLDPRGSVAEVFK
jgi:uncharacterized membrane protein YhaH (DUF805 family)